jgi:hypothetical protein
LKSIVSILLTALLLWTPSAAAGECTNTPVAQDCQTCACEHSNCCVSNAPEAPEPVPAVPAPTSTSLKSQWIAIAVAFLPASDAGTSFLPASTDAFASQPPAVPLHLRHCVFLI